MQPPDAGCTRPQRDDHDTQRQPQQFPYSGWQYGPFHVEGTHTFQHNRHLTTTIAHSGKPLPREFYDRDPRQVSRELLGKVLVRKEGKQFLAARIVEVEAYFGEDDSAAHSFAGRTLRNAVLFGPPGHAYVYFIYGNHYCLNASCLPDGVPGGILFRAVEPLAGIEEMACSRGITITESDGDVRKRTRELRSLTSGPGRMAQAFGITRERDNGKDFTSPRSGLFIADDGHRPRRILVTPRIGITKAAELPLRYIIAGNEFVSGPRNPIVSRARK
jgi:DNA-3-methyladenine glycosylase